jgi:predicted tellurium resistance membrane protein TerC
MSLSNRLWDISILGLPLPNTGKDLVLAVGGLFLIWKSTKEIHEKVEGHAESTSHLKAPSFASVIVQILLLDIIFSLDSVITAVGMSNQIPIMIAAVILAMLVMLLFVNQIGAFVEKYPTIKVLALAFLILIGTMLLAEGFQQHISKGYIYFAMCFSVAVEVINIRVRTKSP